MKYILPALLIGLSISAFSQIKKDSLVLNYIETQNEFISLTDKANIPDSIKPYLNSIATYMRKTNMNPDEYWIWTSYIRTNSKSMLIPIYHHDGFVLKMKLEEKNTEATHKKEGETRILTDFNGNASGKDGNLEIDLKTKNVLSFKLWQ